MYLMLFSLGFCGWGSYYFLKGISAGYNTDILLGGVFMGLGLNISLIHPMTIILSIVASVVGYFFLSSWYYGLFGYWLVQSGIFLIMTGIPFIAATITAFLARR
ncbi:hypothetical protein [Anaeroselena agilis]|uniref:Uncharacterized protein n=1 Tax=Anaeroselena agilis TaxID=3063788 RepID=A0ABU3NZK6_9FIRM|nr:hypothetical protein [Selenomonadales bacterium 4137-cl]